MRPVEMPRLRRLSVTAVLVALLAGCSAVPIVNDDVPRIDSQQDRRREAVLHNHERRRDDVLMRAAVSHWRRGDVAGCQSILTQLLQRNSGHIEARRLLADSYLEQGEVASHQRHLRLLLQHREDGAQAHHSLALTLLSTAREQEAAIHLKRAIQLDPPNKLYRLSGQSVVASANHYRGNRDGAPAVAAP